MDLKFLEFEQPIAELEAKIDELRYVGDDSEININEEVARLKAKSESLTKSIFAKLSAWQIAQVARHPMRPYTADYLSLIAPDFQELHGDRMYADDPAIIGGIGRLDGRPVMFIGHQKGRDTKERVRRNYGMPKPEGYRKAQRLMKMAEKFSMPIVTFIDTPGAYGEAENANHQCRHWRGRLRRRTGHRRRRSAADAPVRHLFGDFPGRLCLDSVEKRG
jgi:acetyl-CoA carboxylase carboxyl transferase subunit alpha